MQIDINQLRSNEYQHLFQARIPQLEIGRSIVTTCYHKEVPSTWVLLNELVRLDCKLPVEIFYRSDELTHDEITLLGSISDLIQIKLIQGTPKDFTSRYGHRHGWACKIYALHESPYSQNLWLDADNCPIKDPTFLFDDPEYAAKGSLFWRDVYSTDSANQYSDNSPMWSVFGVPPNDAEPFETGQLLINKLRCWQEFSLVKWYADNCDIFYHFGGDKETFKMAWQRTALTKGLNPARSNYHASDTVPFGFMPYGPFHKGRPNAYGKWGGGTVMVQRDRSGHELFNHRNMDRFTLGDNVRNDDITNEDRYHAYIDQLKARMTCSTNGH